MSALSFDCTFPFKCRHSLCCRTTRWFGIGVIVYLVFAPSTPVCISNGDNSCPCNLRACIDIYSDTHCTHAVSFRRNILTYYSNSRWYVSLFVRLTSVDIFPRLFFRFVIWCAIKSFRIYCSNTGYLSPLYNAIVGIQQVHKESFWECNHVSTVRSVSSLCCSQFMSDLIGFIVKLSLKRAVGRYHHHLVFDDVTQMSPDEQRWWTL